MASGSESFAVAWSLNHGWLWPHGLQHTRLLCPSLSPGVCSNSCPLNQWCYLIISSSATPFSFSIQSFPASGSLPMSQLFTSSGQTIGASASAPVLPMNIRGWFSLGSTWFNLLVIQGTFKSLLQHHSLKASILRNVVKVKLLITQSCLTFCDPRDCNLPGSSVHGIL